MILTNIELLESYGPDMQLMRLTFDEGKDTAYIIWKHADLVRYLNDEVIATFRQDMYNGTIAKFINTLAGVSKVQTLERVDNVRLYTPVKDNQSNVRFKDIEDGCTVQAAIVYVTDVRFDSSARAEWADITVMDQAHKLAQLRIFSPDNRTADLKHRYVMCDIRRNKYGFATDSLVTVNDASMHYNPEVSICERYLTSAFADTPDILNLLSESKFIEFARKAVDHEPGYTLVRLAAELSIASELYNLLDEVDVDLVRRCLLLEKFRVLSSDSVYDSNIVGFVAASRFKFDKQAAVLRTLYSDDPTYNTEREFLAQVKALGDTVIRAKKGLIR